MTHLKLTQVPDFDDGVVSSRHDERLTRVPVDDVHVAFVRVRRSQHARFGWCSPCVPNSYGFVHRTRRKHLKRTKVLACFKIDQASRILAKNENVMRRRQKGCGQNENELPKSTPRPVSAPASTSQRNPRNSRLPRWGTTGCLRRRRCGRRRGAGPHATSHPQLVPTGGCFSRSLQSATCLPIAF